MKEPEMEKIANWIYRVIDHVKHHKLPADKTQRNDFVKKFRTEADKDEILLGIRKEVTNMAKKFPLFKQN